MSHGIDAWALPTETPRKRSRAKGLEVFGPDGTEGWAPWPIEPQDIERGAPLAEVVVRTTSTDGLLQSGLWRCTAGRFRLTYGCDEIVHILGGGVVLHRGDRSDALKPGDTAFFPAGEEVTWDVATHVHKMWAMRYPDRSLVGRLARQLGAWRSFRYAPGA